MNRVRWILNACGKHIKQAQLNKDQFAQIKRSMNHVLHLSIAKEYLALITMQIWFIDL